MAIGPVQSIVLGFSHPEFHGEIIEEVGAAAGERYGAGDRRGAVHKDADGEIEVAHLSNLSKEEAIELGSKVGALIGLGIEGEEGFEAGVVAGAEAAADGVEVFSSNEDAWDVLEEIPERLGCGVDPDRASLGCAVAGCDRPGERLPDQRRVHQPARPDRDRIGLGRGGRRAPRDGAGPERVAADTIRATTLEAGS